MRRPVVDAARRLEVRGLNRGASGNVSVRMTNGFLVTPSGVPYDHLQPHQVVAVEADGRFEGRWKPSSEWRFHRDIYAARPEVGAIVHTHPPFATSLSCLGRGIPAFHYMVAVAGGPDIRCAPYATFGSQALSDAAVSALEERLACLLANHGAIAVGADLDAAVALAEEVEGLAETYWRALQAGEPVVLSDAEMAVVLAQFAGYGRRSTSE